MNNTHSIAVIRNKITTMVQRDRLKAYHRNQVLITVIEPNGMR